jgi:hypothetical protein
MNEQQLAAVKQALEALETAWTYDEDNADGYYFGAIEAIKQVIAAPVQEPVAKVYRHGESSNGTPWHGIKWLDEGVNMPDGTLLYAAPQPVLVKTYHDGKPWPVAPVSNGPYSAPLKELWPVAPKPWVGLTDDDIHEQGWNLSADRDYEAWTGREFLVVNGVNDFARAIEAKLKEKNHG